MKNDFMSIDLTQVHPNREVFIKAIANYFTCSNCGGMVASWRDMLGEATDEEAEALYEEHAAWSRVAEKIAAICADESRPFTLETADALWNDSTRDLGVLYVVGS